MEFTGPALNKFYMDTVMSIDVDSYPEPLRSILKVIQVKGAIAAPEQFKKAMKWVWDNEEKYVPANLVEEMDAMGEGETYILFFVVLWGILYVGFFYMASIFSYFVSLDFFVSISVSVCRLFFVYYPVLLSLGCFAFYLFFHMTVKVIKCVKHPGFNISFSLFTLLLNNFLFLIQYFSGLCASPLAPTDCNSAEWAQNIKTMNMLPELIKMACTAYGAWGDATKNNGHGGLTQVRALDFGGGPFANYTVIQVHRGDPNSGEWILF